METTFDLNCFSQEQRGPQAAVGRMVETEEEEAGQGQVVKVPALSCSRSRDPSGTRTRTLGRGRDANHSSCEDIPQGHPPGSSSGLLPPAPQLFSPLRLPPQAERVQRVLPGCLTRVIRVR